MQNAQVEITGFTSIIFDYVEHACLLATGTKENFSKDTYGTNRVPRSHMQAAAEIMEQVYIQFKSANFNPDNHWYGWGGTVGRLMINEAIGGIYQIRNTINFHLSGSESEVDACKSHFLYYHYSRLLAAEEFIKVLLGEKFTENSLISEINKDVILHLKRYCEYVDFAAGFYPVIGTILSISKAVSGGTICNKQLSTTERAIEGAFALIPFITRVKSIAESGKKLYTNTITADRILMGTQQMNGAGIFSRTFTAISMGAAARTFSKQEILYVTKIYMKYLKNGIKTPIKVEGEMRRLFYKLSEAGTAAAWMKIAQDTSNVASKSGKYIKLKGANVQNGEDIAAQKAVVFENVEAIHLPENIPSRYLNGEPQLPNVKNPDLLFGGKLADIYIAYRPDLEYIIRDKQKQAGIIIIDLETKNATKLNDAIKILNGIWANPRAWGIETIIIISKEGTRKLMRPEVLKIKWIESVSYQVLKTIANEIITDSESN